MTRTPEPRPMAAPAPLAGNADAVLALLLAEMQGLSMLIPAALPGADAPPRSEDAIEAAFDNMPV